tara:strand:+ start:8599 stop:9132 length:534 start_codon:yes stop_codon:yes gene_type:complete
MAFWTENTAEPKRKFRFKVQIFDNTLAWYCKSITAPSFEISSIEHHFSDHVFHYPGKIKWNDVSVVLIDPGGTEDVVKKTMNLLFMAGYKIPTSGAGPSDYDTLSKSEMVTNNGNVVLAALDESGLVIEDWNLHNAFITSVKFGDFDYSSEDMREIEITFKYDWASCDVEGTTFFRS